MKKEIAAIIMSVFIFSCAKHENVSIDGRDTNRWEIVKDWNGQKGWIGASYHDDLVQVTFEALNNESAFTLLEINATRCNGDLIVDGEQYKATSTKKQKSGFSQCYTQVFGDESIEIAVKMASSNIVNFNGHDTDVRGFESILKKHFINEGEQKENAGISTVGHADGFKKALDELAKSADVK
ncbi:hypothetical protein WH06_01635 [Aeromonas salmonicida subsp. salmonicida]|uniref:Lipoprotein n=2 Tax=Aeromonas salmonicida subsp. salmonicida TaxID=29491 RepID=A0A0A7KVZ2_AERSS|nr:hypothetical protein [Aeromonas salmonicida]AIZ49606.1 hypothetical protein [Aeromonas salmonicida subsp. salmonicida]AIZ49672.1 hypothetical protein [Aeromonas salmonicida subsp. salmonicida]AKD43379.1 hypothetical protein [Aeromonas salmonicida subsp. salmonicida]AOA33881.1 hypothetical protein [Aeromonas salmonicida subsp. salmonicida]AYO63680.1 hypothetical protein C5P03_13355 [Aeromonas salmonicida subsp. salmonicida 01-B526]